MNKSIFCCLAVLISFSLTAQKVTVNKSSEKVKGESVEGFSTELEGKKEDVSSAWIKFLKEIGKVRQSGDPVTISEPVFNGLLFSKGIIYATSDGNPEKSRIWLGIKAAE